jgi:hypothetical protein
MFIFQSENNYVKGHMHKNTVYHLEHRETTEGDQCKVDFAMDYSVWNQLGMSPLIDFHRARICERLRSLGIYSASLCSLEGRYIKDKAVNREDKRSRRYRDRHFAKFERSRRYRDR